MKKKHIILLIVGILAALLIGAGIFVFVYSQTDRFEITMTIDTYSVDDEYITVTIHNGNLKRVVTGEPYYDKWNPETERWESIFDFQKDIAWIHPALSTQTDEIPVSKFGDAWGEGKFRYQLKRGYDDDGEPIYDYAEFTVYVD